MSFEAVPCMFKSRQEDGNEAQLFGLLIRPSPTTAQTQQQSAPTPGGLPIAALSAGPSAIQIVPSPSSSSSDIAAKKVLSARDGRAISRCGSALFAANMTASNAIAPAATLFASGTSNGMPPILPRPKNGKTVARLSQQQQMMRSLVQLPTKTTATLAFEMAQSPQQAMSQFGPATISVENCEALSVSTASSSGCCSSSTPSLLCSSVSAFPSQASPSASSSSNGLLAIHSPPQKAQPQKAVGEKPSTTNSKTPRRRRSKQTLAPEVPSQREGENGGDSSRSNGTEVDGAGGGGADLSGDLHSIEYSQLINSSVITTEDYLPSQSDPIYTNMDMYSSSSLAAAHHRQQQSGQSEANVSRNSEQHQHKQQNTEAEKQSVASSSAAAVVVPSLCPSAIFIHNQQQHHFLNQQPHSSASSSVRFVPSVGAPAAVPPSAPAPSQQAQHASHWHPYMGAHPGGPSHISSTPDSGIQSIDGSPPSVYTPPMVSPYASQVRSCESVSNGAHNGMPSSSSTVCAAGGVVTNPSSSSSINGTISFYGTSAYPSHTDESLTITALNPSSSSLFLSSSLNVPPSLIIEQLPEGQNGGEMANEQQQHEDRQLQMHEQHHQQGAEEEEDFSDMPKLLPVTHTEHDDVTEQDEVTVRAVPGTSAATAPTPTTEDEGKRTTTAPLFHQGMSLQELAECLSSNISREQLKQLTSLIQRKAEEQKNNLEGGGHESREQKSGKDGDSEGEQRGHEREQEQNQLQMMQGQKGQKARQGEEETEERDSRQARRTEPDRELTLEGHGSAKEGAEAAGEGQEKAGGDGQGGDEQAESKARDLQQLAIYRARVRQQLNRKLSALMERVIKRMDKCHLNLSPGGGADDLSPKGWPWRKMNWDEIHRRAEERGEGWMMMAPAEMGRRRGKKRKGGLEEEVFGRRRAEEKKRVNGERSEKEGKTERKVKRGKREEEKGKDDQTAKRGGRKRKGKEEEGQATEKQAKKRHEEEGERRDKRVGQRMEEKQTDRVKEGHKERLEKREEAVREEKQNTPPIILRIRPLATLAAKTSAPTTVKRMNAPRAAAGKSSECVHSSATIAKRRKPSSSPRPSCSYASSSAGASADNFLRERCHSSAALSANDGGKNSAIGGRRWTTGKRTKGGDRGTSTEEQRQSQRHNSSGTRRRRWTRMRRREMPDPENILSDRERAFVHSKGCFLIRNLSRRRPIGEVGTSLCQPRICCAPTSDLKPILERILVDFCDFFDDRFVSHRQLVELIRTAKLMISSTDDPSALLARFDSLLKQFISSSASVCHHHESVHAQYAHLKQSIDFGRAKGALQKDTLSAFLDERAFRSPSLSSRRDTFHRPLTVDTAIDLSYLDSAHPVGQWDPDKAAKLSPTSDNRDHDCVRCICGIAEDEGVMSQCDRCHFWVHADCLDCPVLDDQQEFVCDFCARRIETTPRVDIVLKPQPSIKLSGCTYYRTLVNSRGLQVRLNESVYVERLINDKHKSILRELHEECVRKQQLAQQSPQKRNRGSVGKRKSAGKVAEMEQQQQQDEQRTSGVEANRWWPTPTDDGAEENAEKPSTANGALPPDNDGISANNGNQCFQFHRRDLRVFRIERLFCSPNGQRFIFGCYYARPHETFCDSSRTFYRNELFWTPLFDTLPLDSVVGRCLVLEPQIWAMGRPKSPRYLEDDVFVCEYQIDRNQRSFEKIPPKNRYYINTEPYVFNVFKNKLAMKRNFTPFKITCSNAGDNKPSSSSTASRTDCSCTTSPSLFNKSSIRQQLLQQHLVSVCSKINARRAL